ncbi:MAG: RNA polymerase sigma factor [Actinomycetota bacterium]
MSRNEAEPGSSFDAFYLSLFAPLFRSLLVLSGSPGEAEDIAHEAFVRVFERWESVSRMQAPDAYLFRTALNLERNRVRRLVRRARRVVADRDVQPDFAQETIATLDLLRLLRQLSREQREAIVLVDILGLTSEEAGRVASVRADALRARLHRARTALRRGVEGDE